MSGQVGTSWVEPALSKYLAQGHHSVTLVRPKPAKLRSGVKHSTIEPLRSQIFQILLQGIIKHYLHTLKPIYIET